MTRTAVAFLIAAVLLTNGAGAAEKQGPVKRAKPPVWSQDVLDEFFVDAREQLVGERPAKRNELAAKNQSAGQGGAVAGLDARGGGALVASDQRRFVSG